MRKLASVQKIIEVKPIEGADKIECATVLGWHVVILKGEYKVGQLVIYIETDSLLPVRPEFEFLAKDGVKTIIGEDNKEHTGYRLKTIRLRKQISQGVIIPISSLSKKRKEGADVTKELGVIKYERYLRRNNQKSSRIPVVFPDWLPVKIGFFIKKNFPKLAVKMWGRQLRPFPNYIPKTDEIRLQTATRLLNRYKAKKFYVTEKLDGSSLTLFCRKGKLGICSRKVWLAKDTSNQFWRAIVELGIEDKFKKLNNLAIQGELVGEGIQKNRLKIKGQKVYFFNAYNIRTGKYLPYKDFIALCKDLGVETVPVLDDSFELLKSTDQMVVYATRKSTICPEVWAEGVVFRPLEEVTDSKIGRLSFKVINPEYLLKYGD